MTILTTISSLQQLIIQLFDSSSFTTKLRSFLDEDSLDNNNHIISSKSIQSDTSTEKLQESYHKSTTEVETLITEIETLLTETLQKKGKYPKTNPHSLQIPPIKQQLSQLQSQLQQIKHQLTTTIQKSTITTPLITNPYNYQTYVTIEQHNNWQHQMLQKLDIASKRNLSKIQSIFADKLNSFEINMYHQLENKKDKIVSNQKNSIENDTNNTYKLPKQFKIKQQPNPENPSLNIITCSTSQQLTTPNHHPTLLQSLKSARSFTNLFSSKK